MTVSTTFFTGTLTELAQQASHQASADQPGEMGRLTWLGRAEAGALLLWGTGHRPEPDSDVASAQPSLEVFQGPLSWLHGTFLLELESVICLPAAQGSHVQDPALESVE